MKLDSTLSGLSHLLTFFYHISLQLMLPKCCFKHIILLTCAGPLTVSQTQSFCTTSQTFRDERGTRLKHNGCDDIRGAYAVRAFPSVDEAGAHVWGMHNRPRSAQKGGMFAIMAVLGLCVFVHVCIHKLLLHGLNNYIRAGLIGCLYAWLQQQWAQMHPDGLWVILESGQTVCLPDSLTVLCDTGSSDINRVEAKMSTERLKQYTYVAGSLHVILCLILGEC